MERLLQFFAYEHLPADLQRASKPFGVLAEEIVKTWPVNAERTVALRKLLEAKDAAVRSVLETKEPEPQQQHAQASEAYGAGSWEVAHGDHVSD